jgi:hypothetical protein
MIYQCYHRLGIQPVYRNGCIGRAVARLQRIRCSFHGTADSDLRQARRVLIFRLPEMGRVSKPLNFSKPVAAARKCLRLFQ